MLAVASNGVFGLNIVNVAFPDYFYISYRIWQILVTCSGAPYGLVSYRLGMQEELAF